MKNLLLWLLVILVLLTLGYNLNNKNETIKSNERIIADLRSETENKNKKLIALENEMEFYLMEKDLFPFISNLSHDFVRAHTNGDKESLKNLLADNIKLEERDNELFVSYDFDGQKIEYRLYNPNSDIIYTDMIIQGFNYNPEENTYIVHIREFYIDSENNSISPPFFLDLTFKNFDEGWKIVEISFDI